MKISTKTGDKGKTSLYGGKRISKGALIIDLLGEMDELQCFIGFCRFVIGLNKGRKVCSILDKIQDDLYVMMGVVGSEGKITGHQKSFSKNSVELVEKYIQSIENTHKSLNYFIRPGTTEAAARFHLARAVCRRAERTAVKVKDKKLFVPDEILVYLNRLSDLLFFFLAVKYEAKK